MKPSDLNITVTNEVNKSNGIGFKWSKVSLFFLFVVALIGTLLRSTFFIQIPLKYSNLVHAHSHVAFQGWVYTIIILILPSIFLTESQIKKGRYPLQFKLTVLVVIGVLISFSLQGYALYSIVFSTLFQLLNYWYIYRFFKDIKHIKPDYVNTVSLRFVKTGLWLGLLSTLTPYCIGILSAKGYGGTEIYKSFIYTFLHLQYNGWFLFVALGVFYNLLESNNIPYNKKYAIKFYWLFTVAVIPAITLSLLGMEFSKYIVLPAYIAAILQVLGLIYFLLSIGVKFITYLKQKNGWFQLYLIIFLAAFSLKTLLQSLSAIPMFSSHSFTNKPILLAYLHLSLIGVISFLFLAIMIELKWLSMNRYTKVGSSLFIFGFISTELLLLFNGLGLPSSIIALSIGSAIMALGIFSLILSPQKKSSLRIDN